MKHLAYSVSWSMAAAMIICNVSIAHAQPSDTTTKIRVNGFIDTYYAYDINRPADGERRFTTQAVRHNEANTNLAWIGVSAERRRMRARVALQAGTSVQVNYAGEPRIGATSGPDVSRFLQEAVVGAQLSDKVWIDAGIYYSYIGLEGWSSSDNPTYTRSLVADYSPYYLSGAKLTWTVSPKLTAQVHLTNGWQNISENNKSKAVGGRLDFAPTPTLTLSYANFFGNEQVVGSRVTMRRFHQLMARGSVWSGTQWQAQVDAGQQGESRWYGVVGIARQPVSPRLALVARVERYSDPDQVIIGTSATNGFVGNGASLGVDVLVDGGVRWRTEGRALRTTAALFREGVGGTPTRTNGVLVTSLSVAF